MIKNSISIATLRLFLIFSEAINRFSVVNLQHLIKRGSVVIFIAISHQAFSQVIFYKEPLKFVDGVNFGKNAKPVFTDYNADGRTDLVVGSYDSLIFYVDNSLNQQSNWKRDTTKICESTKNWIAEGKNLIITNRSIYNSSIYTICRDLYLKNYLYNDYQTNLRHPSTIDEYSYGMCYGSGFRFQTKIDSGAAPFLVNIDNDADMDAFLGSSDGKLYYDEGIIEPRYGYNYHELKGDPNNKNPLSKVDVGEYSVPTFQDIDMDGDMDCFVGAADGKIYYFQNKGSKTGPMYRAAFTFPEFEQITGTDNPFEGLDVGDRSAITFADVDGDGDKDAFIANYAGTIAYYRNGSVLTSVEKSKTQNTFAIFPNPAKDQIQIEPRISKEAFQISIAETSGKIVLSANADDSFTINTSSLPQGLYVISMIQNNTQSYQKLVIE